MANNDAHTVLDVTTIGSLHFTTTVRGDEIADTFMTRLGLRSKNAVARLAIARSLSVPAEAASLKADDELGKVIKGQNLFGTEELRTWLTLLFEHGPTERPSAADLQDLVRRHWTRGLDLLEADWTQAHGEYDAFVVHLANQAGLRGAGKYAQDKGRGGSGGGFTPKPVPIHIPIGPISVDLATQKPVNYHLNGRGRSPHVAVMGRNGSGKTHLAKSMLKAARERSGAPMLVFDFKGDLSLDESLMQSIGGTVVDLRTAPVPLDVLHVAGTEQIDVVNAAIRFRDSFAQVPVNSRLGDIQAESVREAALRAMQGQRPVRISDVRDRLREVYAERRKKVDLATTMFSELMNFQLFEPKLTPEEFFSRSWVINTSALPDTTRRLVLFLLLDAAYAYLMAAGESPIDDAGNRALRLIVFVDEAHKLMSVDGGPPPSLGALIRESRSKGGSVFLVSQSPDDFVTSRENYFENIGLGVCFATNARPGPLNEMFKQPVDLAGLPTGVAITRLPDGRIVKVRAWQEDAG
jgi:energy-coupling factor transporter ATP-binding protein EcfA2